MKKLIIKSAHPVISMLERVSMHSFEVKQWRVEYVAYVDGEDCQGCARRQGVVFIDHNRLSISKADLRMKVRAKLAK